MGNNGNTNEGNVRICNSRRGCLTCPVLCPTSIIISTATKRTYKTLNHEYPAFCDCSSSNVVYLLSCNKCSLQYVGQTGRQLRKRISEHRNAIIKEQGSCPFLRKHFKTGNLCHNAGFSVRILEKLPGKGLTDRGVVDRSKVAFRKEKEAEWMLKLRTVYPYGLNHDFGRNLCQGDVVIGKFFPKVSNKVARTPGHSRTNPGNVAFSLDNYLQYIVDTLHNDLHNVPNIFRVSISSLKKSKLKSIAIKLHELAKNNMYQQWYRIIIDLIETKLYKPLPSKPTRKAKFRLEIPFSSKAFDFINLPSILRSNSCLNLIPNGMTNEDIPMVVYSLNKPIRSDIFNYTDFVSSLNLDTIHENPVPCVCHKFDSKYIDSHHHHILTGDLSIISNIQLRDLISKGPKYRVPTKIDFNAAVSNIINSIDVFIDNICSKKAQINKVDIILWRDEVIKLVSIKVFNVSTRFLERNVTNIIDDTKECLKELHNDFVFCPTDKAGNNVAIICKQLYAKVIMDELNLDNIDNLNFNNTYSRVINLSENDIVQQHLAFQSKFQLTPDKNMERLPPMHWTPKIHKSPTGSRFIIGSKKSSLKPLGQDITKIFKVIFHHKRRYFRKAGFFSGLKYFWCIDNHQEVIDALNRLSDKANVKSISTFDFSTLYTKIPHEKLIEVLSKIVDSIFNDTNRAMVSVGKTRAYWVKGFSALRFKFTADIIKECVSFLVNNAYFRVGNAIFRQIIGIPMGSDPAPFFANLFLAYHESLWIKSHSRLDLIRARRLFNTFRYIDDLLTLNDNNEFLRTFKEIYPPELILNKENPDSNTSATFLDLEITIQDNKFEYKLFDKRNAFPFDIVRFPYSSSNMPSKMFFSTISAEILRICRASSQYNTFILACNPFIKRMKRQGATKHNCHSNFVRFKDRTQHSINKMLSKHPNEFSKFGREKEQILKAIIDFMSFP